MDYAILIIVALSGLGGVLLGYTLATASHEDAPVRPKKRRVTVRWPTRIDSTPRTTLDSGTYREWLIGKEEGET